MADALKQHRLQRRPLHRPAPGELTPPSPPASRTCRSRTRCGRCCPGRPRRRAPGRAAGGAARGAAPGLLLPGAAPGRGATAEARCGRRSGPCATPSGELRDAPPATAGARPDQGRDRGGRQGPALTDRPSRRGRARRQRGARQLSGRRAGPRCGTPTPCSGTVTLEGGATARDVAAVLGSATLGAGASGARGVVAVLGNVSRPGRRGDQDVVSIGRTRQRGSRRPRGGSTTRFLPQPARPPPGSSPSTSSRTSPRPWACSSRRWSGSPCSSSWASGAGGDAAAAWRRSRAPWPAGRGGPLFAGLLGSVGMVLLRCCWR